MTKGRTYHLRIVPVIPKALARLEEIAGDLWFSWNARARALFRHIDPDLWESTCHNPRAFLRLVHQRRLDEAARDRVFLSEYHGVLSEYDAYRKEEHQWFSSTFEDAGEHHVAYFSAEFGLHESMPLYSGGLGILAGDHCKSASDLGLPFTAVGLLYRQGYFTQIIDAHGRQIAEYHDNRFEDMCIEPARDAHGRELRLRLAFPECTGDVRVWIARAGHIRLVLLDTDLPDNADGFRGITHQLYGGGLETRIRQEIVLGIGGVRALRLLGVHPTVWHANEGHAAFIVLERMRELVMEHGLAPEAALEVVRASTVFTSHTPVPAGHDVFPLDLFDRHLGDYVREMGMDLEQVHALGHGDFNHHGAGGFNQTALAIRGSAHVNGVSRRHQEVASRMYRSAWPDLEPQENPVKGITNGVHVATWLAPEWIHAFDQHLGGRWRGCLLDPDFWKAVQDIPDHHYWGIHQAIKQRMLQYVRRLLERQARRNGESSHLVQQMTALFDVRTLVVGFARRFATYKRPALLFHDEARLCEILSCPDRPVVFLFAGKAHPADAPGQELIRRIHEYARRPEFMGRVLMLEGYDMALARHLIAGVDVWLNNPIRPLEASGTSGMKAAMNGVPNLSILDGWWVEGFQGDNGWVIGGEREIADPDVRDADDAASLYHVLEHQVIPTYYDRNGSGFSEAWVRISKRAMMSSIPHFNTDRMVSEYARRFYVPASRHGRLLASDGFRRARNLAEWKARVRASWPNVRLERLDATGESHQARVGDRLDVRVKVHHEGLSPEDIRVEIVLLRVLPEGDPECRRVIAMTHVGDGVFHAEIDLAEAGDFAYRIRAYPFHEDLAHPLAMGRMTYL